MTYALSLDATESLAFELYEFIRDIDASRWKREMQAALLDRLESLEQQLFHLIDGTPVPAPEHVPLYDRLAELYEVIRDYAPDTELAGRAARREWRRLRKLLLEEYEELATWLRAEAVDIPSLRPTNYNRIALHVSSMVFVLFLLWLPLSAASLIAFSGFCAGTCWTLEILRRKRPRMNAALMAFFEKVAHPVEAHRVNSSTWYATALFVLSWMDSPVVGGAAVVVLGIGDTVAGLVGRRWGRTVLLNGRTLEGSLAFVVASFLLVIGFFAIFHPSLGLGAMVLLGAAAAISGALTELLSRNLDDNFTIPISAAATALAVALLFGVPIA